MSMIKCPGCGQEVSDQAEKCVHCGAALKEMKKEETGTRESKCTECGRELSEADQICPSCGCPVERKKKVLLKINKKIAIIIGSIFGAAAMISIVCLMVFNANPVKKYIYLFHHDKSKKAIEVFSEKIVEDGELVSQLTAILNPEMDEIYNDFKNNKISIDEAKEAIEHYSKYEPSMKYASEQKKKIESLYSSRIAYSDAQTAENDGDILKAIKGYQEVIEEDQSYTDAQGKIQNLHDVYKTQLLNEAENYIQNKQYTEAISNVDHVISILGSSDDLTALKLQYETLKEEQYAKIEVTGKIEVPKDTYNWIFNDSVKFVFNITNNSDKAIAGVEGVLTINDMFGKKINGFLCDFTNSTIQPGETYVETNLYYDCNPYIDEDMQLYNTAYKDLQFKYAIKNIVFEDGSKVTPE